MGLRLNVRGVQETREALRRFIEEIPHLELLWLDYADILSAFEEEWFATAGRGAWPPLSHWTIRKKEKLGYPPDPMIRTGNLLESLTNPEQAGRVDQGRSTLGTFGVSAFSWGTDVVDERGKEYAQYHQEGEGSNKKRQVIAWPLPPDVQAELEHANERFAEEIIRASGL